MLVDSTPKYILVVHFNYNLCNFIKEKYRRGFFFPFLIFLTDFVYLTWTTLEVLLCLEL